MVMSQLHSQEIIKFLSLPFYAAHSGLLKKEKTREEYIKGRSMYIKSVLTFAFNFNRL